MSSGRDAFIYLPNHVALSTAREVAAAILGDACRSVDNSAYPGYLRVVFQADLVVSSQVLDEFEQELGIRPLRELEVDALFDPVTGQPLEHVQ